MILLEVLFKSIIHMYDNYDNNNRHPLDRTSELRQKGYATRRLGPKQMTTDTAVRVTRLVAQEKGKPYPPPLYPTSSRVDISLPIVPLDKVPYVDYPELRLDEHETTEMPFRYVKDEQGKPIMPDVRYLSILRTQTD